MPIASGKSAASLVAASLVLVIAAACSSPPESRTSGTPDNAGSSEEGYFDGADAQVEVSAAALAAAPSVGRIAPDFSLPRVGGGTAHLSDAAAEQPVVLIFGSYT